MPFFFIFPLWLLAVIVGAVMVAIPRLRAAGVYVLTTASLATIASFGASTAVLVAGAALAVDPPGWFGPLILVAYLGAIPIGGAIGALAGVLLARTLVRRHGPRAARGG